MYPLKLYRTGLNSLFSKFMSVLTNFLTFIGWIPRHSQGFHGPPGCNRWVWLFNSLHPDRESSTLIPDLLLPWDCKKSSF